MAIRDLTVDQVQNLLLEDMKMDPAPGSDQPVLRLNDADGVLVRQSRIASVHVTGAKSRGVRLVDTEAKATTGDGVSPVMVK